MKKILFALALFSLIILPAFSADVPAWLEGWKFKGDLRVRYEGFDFDKANKDNRSRGRFRLRLAADKKLNDKLAFKMRLASGSGDPTSTNQTFDNSFSGKDIVIDRAFLTYKVSDWEVGSGKFSNPFHKTNMVWDSDVNPEGIYGKFGSGNFFLNMGGMVVQEEKSSPDMNLGAVQVGLKGGDRVGFKGSIAYYVYEGLEIGGDDYTFIDALAEFTIDQVSIKLDYAQNITSAIDDYETAWAVFAKFGKGKKPGDWTFYLKYAEIEAFSVFGPLADSDFGFADKEGFVGAVTYKSTKHLGWSVKAFSIDGIIDTDSGYDRLQVDCQLKF